MTKRICIVLECDRPVSARGVCSTCYRRLARSGELEEFALTRKATNTITNVDPHAMTCDCSRHGIGVKLRVRPSGRAGRYSCRQCSSGDNGRKRYPTSREARLRWKYGITLEEYDLRFQGQGGACLICQEPLVAPVIDHDHDLGHVRGILCRECNLGLGFFRDNPAVMRRAIKYLARNRLPAC